MDLRAKHGHMAGKKVRVNGTDYEVDKDCVVKGLSAEHAKKLLANPEGWAHHRSPASEPPPAPVVAAPVRTPQRPSAPPSIPAPDDQAEDPSLMKRVRAKFKGGSEQ